MSLRNPLTSLRPEKAPLNLFRLLLAAGILGGVLLCSLTILAGALLSSQGRQPEQDRLAALAQLRALCGGGGGHAQAAALAGAGPHRLVVFRSNIAGSTDLTTFYNRTEDYPAEWHASGPDQAELVACVHTGSVILEECAYTLSGGAQAVLQRVQWTAIVNLYTAQTADLIAQAELPGSEPRPCRQQEEFQGSALTQPVYGEAVAPAQIQAWLSGFVE